MEVKTLHLELVCRAAVDKQPAGPSFSALTPTRLAREKDSLRHNRWSSSQHEVR